MLEITWLVVPDDPDDGSPRDNFVVGAECRFGDRVVLSIFPTVDNESDAFEVLDKESVYIALLKQLGFEVSEKYKDY